MVQVRLVTTPSYDYHCSSLIWIRRHRSLIIHYGAFIYITLIPFQLDIYVQGTKYPFSYFTQQWRAQFNLLPKSNS